MEGLGLDPELVKAFNEIISERGNKQSERSDSLIWVGSKDGRYSVKQGYKVLVNAHSWKIVEVPLKLCWDNACLPKAGFSLWLAIQNRVLTADRLSKFGFIGPSRCILCKNDNENAEHLFYKCPFAQSCWEWLKSRLSWSSPSLESFQDFILSWPTHLEYGTYSKLWNISPSIIVWEL